jgi:hypothetical protein
LQLLGLRHIPEGDIVFQITQGDGALFPCANGDDAVAVDAALHAERREELQRRPEHPAEPEIPPERAVGDPAVGEQHRNPAAGRLTREVRPDLGLHDDHQLRGEGAQGSAHRRKEIEGETDIDVDAGDASGDLAAGGGAVGNEQGVPRVALPERQKQRLRGKGFPDRDGMDPDHRAPAKLLQLGLRDLPEPFRQSRRVGSTQLLIDMEQGYREEQQGGDEVV